MFDCVRFGLIRQSDERVAICYVYERNHRPGERGTLEYDIALGGWISPHSDARVQKMAECYLAAYLARQIPLCRTATTGQ